MFHLFNVNETSDFLKSLDINANYLVTIEFISDISNLELDTPRMILSQLFIINRFSSETTITKFIHERLDLMVECYFLDDTIVQEARDKSGPIVLLTYSKFYIK
jgi:hypothetical protein